MPVDPGQVGDHIHLHAMSAILAMTVGPGQVGEQKPPQLMLVALAKLVHQRQPLVAIFVKVCLCVSRFRTTNFGIPLPQRTVALGLQYKILAEGLY